MLQVTVTRLSGLWPNALIEVITDAPDHLAVCCPQARPLHPRTRSSWRKVGRLFGQLHQFGPMVVSQQWLKLERAMWCYWPWLALRLVHLKVRRRGLKVDLEDVNAFAEAFFGADLIVASGGGYMTDAYNWIGTQILETLETAAKFGIPTAMFGQGLGPIEQLELRARMKAVLPAVNLIALREKRVGLPLLDSLGVSSDRVMITGDDTIELAYDKRPTQLEMGIGLNLRTAAWLEMNNGTIEIIRTVIHEAACRYGARLIPLPTSFFHKESDVRTIQQLLTGYDDEWDGEPSLATPLKIIEQVGCCRLVITGSYHPAVFALAQGIPVVALAQSTYFVNKFLGLVDQFGAGCEVILLDDEQLREKLVIGIDNAWKASEPVRAQLLKAAVKQIKSGQAAYQHLYELVERRRYD